MSSKLPVVYSIHGHPPNLSSGGPFRVVGSLLHGLTKQSDSCIEPILITLDGIYEGERLWDSYARRNQVRCVRIIKRIVSHRHDLLPFASFMLSNRVLPISPIRKLQTMIAYADKRTADLWRSLRQRYRIAIVHSHLNMGAIPFLRDRDIQTHKVVVTYHSKGSLVDDYSSAYKGLLESPFGQEMKTRERFELQNADVVVFPSKGALRLMQSHHPGILDNSDVRIIYNGIDIERIDSIVGEVTKSRDRFEYSQGDDSFTILNVAAHVQQKRVDLLLEAIASLKDEIPIRLINVGSGPLLEANKRLAAELRIADRVEFLGPQDNRTVIKLMCKCDAFVMPSENVVFDLVTLEAMAVGMPVIVSADGGNLECIQDGVNGILVKVGDARSVRDAIRFVYGLTKQQRAALGQSARRRVISEFSLSSMVSNYVMLYLELFARVACAFKV